MGRSIRAAVSHGRMHVRTDGRCLYVHACVRTCVRTYMRACLCACVRACTRNIQLFSQACDCRCGSAVASGPRRAMGRSKLGSSDKDRRPRVDTAASDVPETDPIAAAAHAKKAREGVYLNIIYSFVTCIIYSRLDCLLCRVQNQGSCCSSSKGVCRQIQDSVFREHR